MHSGPVTPALPCIYVTPALPLIRDHMVRDINAGRFANKTNLVLVTHGLALRVFLMRWFHWTLEEYLMVHNPPNAEVGLSTQGPTVRCR